MKAEAAKEAEVVIILYSRDSEQPTPQQLGGMVTQFEKNTGISIEGIRLSAYSVSQTNEDFALAFIARLQGEGAVPADSLQRTVMRTFTGRADGAQVIMAAVLKKAQGVRADSSWERELIPMHLEKLDQAGMAVAWRPGWTTLTSEAALAFVTRAANGAVLQLDEVAIMVSRFDETDPERIRPLMPGGYRTWAIGLGLAGGVMGDDKQVDVAHWLLCAKGGRQVVHLGYWVPSERHALVPWDLLPPGEQQETPRIT